MDGFQNSYAEWKKQKKKKEECILSDFICTEFYKIQTHLQWHKADQ